MKQVCDHSTLGSDTPSLEKGSSAKLEIFDEILDEAPARLRETIDDFVRESQEELFDTREACVAWSVENYEGLLGGTLGGNLLSKYSLIGRFLPTHEALDFLERAIASRLAGKTQRAALASVVDYLRCMMLSSPFSKSLSESPVWETLHDVEAWCEDDYAKELDAYGFDAPRRFSTAVSPDRRAAIETRIETFGDHPAGLGKFTRTMFASELRRSLVPAGEVSALA